MWKVNSAKTVAGKRPRYCVEQSLNFSDLLEAGLSDVRRSCFVKLCMVKAEVYHLEGSFWWAALGALGHGNHRAI